MDFGIASVATITVICYLVGQAVKASGLDNKWIPIICGIVGGILGVLAMRFMADFPAGLHNRSCSRHCIRLRGDRRQRGSQAAQTVINIKAPSIWAAQNKSL